MTKEEFMKLKPGDIVLVDFLGNKNYVLIREFPTVSHLLQEHYAVKCFSVNSPSYMLSIFSNCCSLLKS